VCLSAQAKINKGRVIAAGKGKLGLDGKHSALTLKEGDVILLPNFGFTEVNLNDKNYVVTREEDVLAVFPDEK